jgi:imidazolonepropionase-like amidohydrolase
MLSPQNEDAGEVQLSQDEIRAAVEIAEAAGKHVASHAHALEGIRRAVEAGARSIEHGTHADEDMLRRMAERGVFLVPTCSASSAMLADEGIVREIPEHLRRRLTESRDTHVAAVRAAHRLGVPIAMGTDAGTPGNNHGRNAQECVAMVEEVGLTPAESLRSATLQAARLLRSHLDLGSLEPGRFADVIGVEQDPLQDIRALMDVAFVMKGGRLF